MTDVHSSDTRSFNMSKIKGKDTKPEILVRKFLFAKGFRYRLHERSLPGKPDLVLSRYKAAIFVNGCFWHGHSGCKYFIVPKTRTEWWLEKIGKNKINDRKNSRKLLALGWNVLKVWECELKKTKIDFTLERLAQKIKLISA